MNDNIFEELVIYVLTYPGANTVHRNGLISKLEAHGAEVRTRFGKDVTHVVVQQTHSALGDDRVAGDAQLRGLFDKIEKGHDIVQTVSMGWVQKCLECQRRVMERPFALQKPQEPILPPGKSPATAGRSAKKRRTKGVAAVAGGTSKKVVQAAALDVNEPLFSSSQQLQELRSGTTAAAPSGSQLPPDLSPRKQPRNIRVVFSDQLQQQQQLRGLSAREAAAAARSNLQQTSAAAPAAAVAFKSPSIGPETQHAAAALEELTDDAFQESAFDDADQLPGLTVHWRTPAAAVAAVAAAAAEGGDRQGPAACAQQQQQQQQRQQQVVEESEDVIEDSDDDNDSKFPAIRSRQHPAGGTASAATAAGTAGAEGGSSAAAAASGSGGTSAAVRFLPAAQAIPAAAAAAGAQSVRKTFTPRQRCNASATPPSAAAAAVAACTSAAAAAASAGKQSGGLSAKAALSGLSKGSGGSKRKRSSLLSRKSGLFSPPAVLDQRHQQQQQQQELTSCATVIPPIQVVSQPQGFSFRELGAPANPAAAVASNKTECLSTPELGQARSAAAAAADTPVTLTGRKRRQPTAAAAEQVTPVDSCTPARRSTAAANKQAAGPIVTPPAAAAGTPHEAGTAAKRRRIPARLLPWACAVCTLENAGTASKCEACGAMKAVAGIAAVGTPAAGSSLAAAAAAAGEDVTNAPLDTAAARTSTARRAARSRRAGTTPQPSKASTSEAAGTCGVKPTVGVSSQEQEQKQQHEPPVTPRSARYLARTQGRTQQQHQPEKDSSTPAPALQLPPSTPAAAPVVAAGPADGRWGCYGCTFDNTKTVRKCKMCGAKKPFTAAPAPAAVATAAETTRDGGAAAAAAAQQDGDIWLPPSGTEDHVEQAVPCSGADGCSRPRPVTGEKALPQDQQQQLEAGQAATKAYACRASKGRPSLGTAAAAAAATAGGGTPVLEGLPTMSRIQRPQLEAATAQKQRHQQQHSGEQQTAASGGASELAASAAAALAPAAAKAPLTSSTKGNQQQQQRSAGAASTCGKSAAAAAAAAAATASKKASAAPTATAGSSGPSSAAAAAGSGNSSQRSTAAGNYIAWTSVSSAVAQLAKSAVKRLPGFRVCVDGHEEGRVTHMVVGAERRTLKLLLAVANGALLLTPEWVTDSLEKGAWQPVEQYTADIRFSPISAAVRAAHAAGSYQGPLAGKLVMVQCAAQGGGAFGSAAAAAEHRQSMQRLVRALGGRVCGARAAEVCVVCGSSPVPRELPSSAVAVHEEWLLLLAETHEDLGNTREFEVSRS